MASHSQQTLDALGQQIGIELIQLLPHDWDSALLTLEVTEKGIGAGLAHKIANHKGKRDVIVPNDALLLATRRLELYCKEHKINFNRTTVKVWLDGENWELDLKFHYSDTAEAEKKSWWRW